MPDENAAAYWGRVLRLNAVPAAPAQEAAFTMRMHRQMRADGEEESELTALIGAVAGVPLSTVVRSHTLVPLWGAMLAVVDGNWCDDTFQSRELRRCAMKAGACVRALCPMCASEDIDYWGFSYWRRSHQIASVAWCQKHACPLLRTRECDSWQAMPHEVMARARSESADVCIHSMENPDLRRYAEICNELLQRSRPLSTAQVLRALVRRARSHGLAVDPTDRGRRLSDMAAERVAGPWQAVFWRELSSKAVGEHMPTLDGVLSRIRAALGIHSYALAIALMYDSADAALLDIEVGLPPASLLYAAIDAEAVRRARNELPRTPDDDACRRERLRHAVALVLSGEPLHSAARYTGWAPLTFERMLVHCLTAERADELIAASCELTPSHR